MSTIALPPKFCPNSFILRLQTNQRVVSSPGGGSEQVIDMLNDRWVISLTLPNRKFYDAALIESFIASMRGMTNTVRLHHFVRPQPRGTMRGTLKIFLATGPGADSIYVEGGQPFASVGGGDLFEVNGMLLQAAEDRIADANGRIGIPIASRLRRATVVGQAVVWDKPGALFRMTSASAVQYIPGYSPEVPFDFVEAIL